MILYGDYHTHSNYSDGKSSLEENAKSAVDKHLKQMAATEHGFAHVKGGIKREQVPQIKERLKKIKKDYGLDVLFGIEANLISQDGDLDISVEEVSDYDIVILGYHKLFHTKRISDWFNFLMPNTFRMGRSSKKRIEKNTQAFIKAIEKYDVDIVAHLNTGRCIVDPVKVAKAAKERGAYIELNGKRLAFTDQEILDMAATGVKFIVNSDAHKSKNVGLNNKALALIDRLNIPHDQVVNLDKIPQFKRCNKEKK